MYLRFCACDVAYSAGVATRHFYISDTKLVPAEGFEPSTYRLQGDCSTK